MHALLARSTSVPLFVGVVHLDALPGSPRYAGSMTAILDRAGEDTEALVEGGVDAIIVENFGDAPFLPGPLQPETVAAMALAVANVQGLAGETAVGVNCLRNDARGALGLCAATGASFLRVNVHTGAMVTDQGVIEGRAAETLRERTRLSRTTAILADVHVKHAAPLVPRPISEEAVEASGRGGADAIIVSGSRTGAAPVASQLDEVREAIDVPLFLGSGLGLDNAANLLPRLDGAIVGTALKVGGRVSAPVDPARVAALRSAFDR